MNINEKAAYLKGVFDGSDLDMNKKEVKLIGEMLDLISKMATRISELEAECSELREYAEELDEDLGAVEEDLYFTDDDEDDYDELPELKTNEKKSTTNLNGQDKPEIKD